MFAGLFFKECRQVLKSLTYLIFAAALLLFYFTQIGLSFEIVSKPQLNAADYGIKYEEIPEVIMPNAVRELSKEYRNNSYTAYPVGFYKEIKLNEKKQKEIEEILNELTGLSGGQVIEKVNNYFSQYNASYNTGENNKVVSETNEKGLEIDVLKTVTYERFRQLMKNADRIIGGGSKYSSSYIISLGRVQKTYEDALTEYNNIIEKDRVTGAYARLFCDYLGIVLAIFPVFAAVALSMRDRRAKMQELAYSRKISSIGIISARYMALIFMMFVPVLLLSIVPVRQFINYYKGSGINIDVFAFAKYALTWLLPTIMVPTAVGMCLTELTDTPIAIAVQGLWWLLGMFNGLKYMDGGYGWSLALRHNVAGNTQVYLDNIDTLLVNRITYTLFAAALVLLSALFYELKRGGRLDVWGSIAKIFSNRKAESEA